MGGGGGRRWGRSRREEGRASRHMKHRDFGGEGRPTWLVGNRGGVQTDRHGFGDSRSGVLCHSPSVGARSGGDRRDLHCATTSHIF